MLSMMVSKHRAEEHALNVIIPIGGIGSRFSKEGYRYPKPLINLVGRPMLFCLIDHLNITTSDTLFVAIRDIVDDEFHLGLQLQKEYPQLNIRLIPLRYDTIGATETLFLVHQTMSEAELGRRTVSLDCDTIYFRDILEEIRQLPPSTSGTVVFSDEGDKPVFSYVSVDANWRITDIKEKMAISKLANTGAYIFASGRLFRDHAASFLDENPPDNGLREYYTSTLIGVMIARGVTFRAIPIGLEHFHCVGTPSQLEAFLELIRKTKNNLFKIKKRRFCFDLDSTLVTLPVVPGDYSTCRPIPRTIQLVRELHADGHHIIIQTARRMKTHSGNVGAVIRDIGRVTFDTLERFNIPYDEIFFGKPYAHIYVDDLAVNARLDTSKELGWWRSEPEPLADKERVVTPRSFNSLQVFSNKVIKSSKTHSILGEIFFYTRVPDDIRMLFPRILDYQYLPETGTYTMTLEKLEGMTYSHLIVNGGITNGRLDKLLHGIQVIHQSSGVCSEPLPLSAVLPTCLTGPSSNSSAEPTGSIYGNYAAKLVSRYNMHKELYDTLGPDCHRLKDILVRYLREYEHDDRAYRSNVIHGDPVFSNIILRPDNSVAFVDMRGQLEDVFSMRGDALYDLAKIYQSLRGYDFILLQKGDTDTLTNTITQRALSDLRARFWRFLDQHYPSVRRLDVAVVTASLLFSLIPLHDANHHRYLTMCRDIIDEVGISQTVKADMSKFGPDRELACAM